MFRDANGVVRRVWAVTVLSEETCLSGAVRHLASLDDKTQHAGAALAHVAENGTSETARIGAACAILDRGYGRPREATHAQYQRRGAGIFDDD